MIKQLFGRLLDGSLSQFLSPELSLVLEKEIPSLHQAIRLAYNSMPPYEEAEQAALPSRAVKAESTAKTVFSKAFSRLGSTLRGARVSVTVSAALTSIYNCSYSFRTTQPSRLSCSLSLG